MKRKAFSRIHTLLFIGFLLFCLAGCKKEDKTPLVIGQAYQGGVIAYLLVSGDLGYDATVQHGLIAAGTDQSSGAEWGCNGSLLSGANASGVGSGNQNTIDIINGCSTAGTAASLCAGLNQNGYDDWYLPSIDELNKLYLNRDVIGGFTPGVYWSSTEENSTMAWLTVFSSGNSGTNGNKSNLHAVRAVRSF